MLCLCLLVVWSIQAEVSNAQLNSGHLPTMQAPLDVFAIRQVTIDSILVEGARSVSEAAFLVRTSGLQPGQQVTIPGDPAFGSAIRSIDRLRKYADVKVVERKTSEAHSTVVLQVQEMPRLGEYTFTGIKKKQRRDLKERVPLLARAPIREADIDRTIGVIKGYYAEKGHPASHVDLTRHPQSDGTIDLRFAIDRGPFVEIEDIQFTGNVALSQKELRKQLGLKEDRWWRFWKRAKFHADRHEEDLLALTTYMHEKGYYDGRIVRDTTFLDTSNPGEPGYIVAFEVYEGPQYHIRNVTWEGNTVYTDAQLAASLGIEAGDRYNGTKLQQNLYANRNATDVSSLYMNKGYMTFRVQPTLRVTPGDSLDVYLDVVEGDVYAFGSIVIAGNDRTKDHVVRRELYTLPGQTFSRDAIQESIRRLMQLNYFSQESLGAGPGVEIDDQKKVVDLTYNLIETGSEQLQLSGTWASTGLVLSLGFEFNNFSAQNLFRPKAWRPIPTGDGQTLSLGVQTSGRAYQNYSIGFTEPWFRGRPTPIGANISYSFIGDGAFTTSGSGSFTTFSARTFYEQRLTWPDDKFSMGTSVGYQIFDNNGLYTTLPEGRNNEITIQQTLTRNSTNHPVFPSSGSQFRLSATLAPPVGGSIQYHKWRLGHTWHTPIAPKLTLSLSGDFGYIGSLNGGPVDFQRFVVGGSPFDAQGIGEARFLGTDIVYMRGYPASVIGPRRDGDATGGRLLNKFTSELRWMAIQSDQLQAAPYLFMDAANAWDSFDTYNPGNLYRSAGVGVRMTLPILGLLELTYGYNFDAFTPLSTTDHDGSKQWLFQFTLGRGFN